MAAFSNEPSSPRSSVNVHRSQTSRRPYLSIDPVEFSLTDGTSIPPPAQEADTASESPVSSIKDSPTKEEHGPNGITRTLSPLSTGFGRSSNGPLSSHPVTPIDNPNGSDKGSFPFNRQGSNSFGSQNANGSSGRMPPPDGTNTPARAVTPNTSSPLSHHQHNGMPQPTQAMSPPESDHSQNPPQGLQGHRARRPSFAERFLRLRSISGLRSRNSSKSNVEQTQHVHNDGSQFSDGSNHTTVGSYGHGSLDARGIKRPGSPSVAGLFRNAQGPAGEDLGEPGQRGSQSFPRMMRKKSMELLGTARRKSGMWSGNTMNDMMAEEYEREKLREQELDAKTDADSMEIDRRYSKTSKTSTTQHESPKEPPPTLPELGGLTDMGADNMFSNIGKDR